MDGSIPSWMDMGVIPGATNDFESRPFDEDRGKKLKNKLTWCTFMSYIQRTGLQVRRLPLSYFGDEVGRGQFFEVYRYKVQAGLRKAFTTQNQEFLEAGTVVALKRAIPRSNSEGRVDLDDSRQLRAIATEVQALTKRSLREHEHIIEMYGLAWEDRGGDLASWPTIIMEYCPCTLAELQAERKTPLSTQVKIQLTQGVSFGMDALHEEDIVHGDVKSENVLIKVMDDGVLVPKLADFGSSVVQLTTDLVYIGGTKINQAPECVTLKGMIPVKFAVATDIYSLGLLIWRVFLNGRSPFASVHDLDYLYRAKSDDEQHTGSSTTRDFSRAGRDLEEECPETVIQRLKETESVIQMMVKDVRELIDPPAVATGYEMLLSASLIANPESRLEAFEFFDEKLAQISGAPSEEVSVDESRHPLAVQGSHIVQIPLSIFSIHLAVQAETRDFEFHTGEPTRKRLFNELLGFVEEWSLQSNLECETCCRLSIFDQIPVSKSLSVDDFIQHIIDEFPKHTTCNKVSSLSYETMANLTGMKTQNEVFPLILNLFICYIEGYGVEANVDEGLRWLLQSAKWGSVLAQSEIAVCFAHFKKPIPSDVPVIKWLMLQILLFDLVSARNALMELSAECCHIAREARWRLFNGMDTTVENWMFNAEEDLSLDEYDRFRNLSDKKISTSDASDSVIDGNGDTYNFVDDGGNGPLHWLASSWREPTTLCQRFYESYPDLLEAANSRGETPLLLACRSRRRQMVSLLLSLGADPNRSAGKGGETPLHWVVLDDDDFAINMIDDLLTHGADINTQSTEARLYSWHTHRPSLWSKRELFTIGSPLHWAVLTGRMEIVRFLVIRGAIVDLENVIGETPLSIAVSMRRDDILEVLLEDGKRQDVIRADGHLLRRLYTDSTRYARGLQGFDSGMEQRTLEVILRYRSGARNADGVERFFKWAVYNGVCAMSFDLLSKLLDYLDLYYMECSTDDYYAIGTPLAKEFWAKLGLIHFAVRRNDPQILDLVLQKGVDIKGRDDVDYSCLHTIAVNKSSDESLKVLLSHGADLGWRTNNGWLPFHMAVFAGNTDMAQAMKSAMSTAQFDDALGTLMNRKASRFAMTFFGHAIMLRSLSFARIDGIEWLLRECPSAIDFDKVCPEGQLSPLHLAVDGVDTSTGVFRNFGTLPILRLLLTKYKSKEQLNSRDAKNVTPLHLAVHNGRYEEVRVLVEKGADVNANSPFGTPLDVTFMVPPNQLTELELGATREMTRRFMENRNSIAKYLRENGARALEELHYNIKLGDWVPYAIDSGECVEYFQVSTFSRLRRHAKYGCAALRPRVRPERYMEDGLTVNVQELPEYITEFIRKNTQLQDSSRCEVDGEIRHLTPELSAT